jgi:hypothetical protein
MGLSYRQQHTCRLTRVVHLIAAGCVRWFEVDQPDVLVAKRAALEQAGASFCAQLGASEASQRGGGDMGPRRCGSMAASKFPLRAASYAGVVLTAILFFTPLGLSLVVRPSCADAPVLAALLPAALPQGCRRTCRCLDGQQACWPQGSARQSPPCGC